MRQKMMKTSLAALALLGTVAGANAATIGSAAGLNLTSGTTQSAGIRVYAENTGVSVVAGDVTVDLLVGDNFNVGDTANGVWSFSTGPTLAAGTYDSFLVHFDPLSRGGASAIIDFGKSIMALIVSNSGSESLLNSSDRAFGNAASYEQTNGRRTESSSTASTNDSFTLLNGTTLDLSLFANNVSIDNVRVITASNDLSAVPVPASLPLLLVGLGGLGLMNRRKKA